MSGESRCMPVCNFIRSAYEWVVKKLTRKEGNDTNVHNSIDIHHNVKGGTNTFTENVNNVNNINITNNYGASRSQQNPVAQEDQNGQQVEMTNQHVYSVPETSWVESHLSSIPSDAFIAGRDINDEVMYVGRAEHEGSLIPGKVIRSHEGCLFAWGGEEHGKIIYEVLVGNARWIPATGSSIPPNAIEGGKTKDGETLFIGRALHKASFTIGRVQRSLGGCYIPFGGKEVKYSHYEILVV